MNWYTTLVLVCQFGELHYLLTLISYLIGYLKYLQISVLVRCWIDQLTNLQILLNVKHTRSIIIERIQVVILLSEINNTNVYLVYMEGQQSIHKVYKANPKCFCKKDTNLDHQLNICNEEFSTCWLENIKNTQ